MCVCVGGGGSRGGKSEGWQEDPLGFLDGSPTQGAGVHSVSAPGTAGQVTTRTEDSVHLGVHTHTAQQLVLETVQLGLELL